MNKHEQRSEETRSRILKAAEGCFALSGYDGTTVSQICEAAGVSKGALYHHFDSKQAIFLELLSRWLKAMDFQLAGLGDDRPATLLAELSKMHERAIMAPLGELARCREIDGPRGEYVVVVGPMGADPGPRDVGPDRIRAAYAIAMDAGLDRKEALKAVAKRLGVRRRDVFDSLVDSEKNNKN